MMRGFQIWPQNSNRTTFALPLFRQNRVDNWQNTHYGQFLIVLRKKEGQMFFHLNFSAMFGILSSFSISYDPICYYFHI